jgi:hypothetical protein
LQNHNVAVGLQAVIRFRISSQASTIKELIASLVSETGRSENNPERRRRFARPAHSKLGALA